MAGASWIGARCAARAAKGSARESAGTYVRRARACVERGAWRYAAAGGRRVWGVLRRGVSCGEWTRERRGGQRAAARVRGAAARPECSLGGLRERERPRGVHGRRDARGACGESGGQCRAERSRNRDCGRARDPERGAPRERCSHDRRAACCR